MSLSGRSLLSRVNWAAVSETPAVPACGATCTWNAFRQEWLPFFLPPCRCFPGPRVLAAVVGMTDCRDDCSVVPGEPVVLVAGEDEPSPADGEFDTVGLVEGLVDGLVLPVEVDELGDGEPDVLDEG